MSRKPRPHSILAALAIALGALWTLAGTARAQDTELGPVFLLSLGGKLYDDVWIVLDEPRPQGRNPALDDASVALRDSWRCATCHGWDYSGAEYGERHFPALTGLADMDPALIREKILDPTHPFPADRLPDLALDILALFISEGQYGRSNFIDESGVAFGNPEFGRDIFEGACTNCHQLDGRRFLRGERGDRSSLGWVSRNRPEQVLHKMINGVPGAEMLSLRFLSLEQIADLMAYLQSLDATAAQ